MREIKYEVEVMGKAIPGSAWLVKASDGIVAIELDMRTKWAEISATSSTHAAYTEAHLLVPGILIDISERSLHMDDEAGDQLTHITFPEYLGWEVWAANLSRYTCCICLTRP